MMSRDTQARALYVALMTTDDAAAVWRALQIWRNASAENRQAFRSVEDAWRGKDILERPTAADEDLEEEVLNAPAAPTPHAPEIPESEHTGWPWLALVACLWVGGVCLFVWVRNLPPPSLRAASEQGWTRNQNSPYNWPQTVTLPDQSTMRLGPGTVIRWKFTNTKRQFALERGRVLFTVQTDQRPFYVQAGATAVVAHGTIFSVERPPRDTGDEVWTHVTSGEVAVTPQRAAPVRWLRAGQLAHIRGEYIQIESSVPLTDSRLIWTGDVFEFWKAPLPEAVKAFNEHNSDKLQIVDPRLARSRVGGQFKGHDPRAFAHSLEESGIARVDWADPHVIRLQAPPEEGTSAPAGEWPSQHQ